MNLKSIAAVAGTVLALSAGSAFAWDLHDTLAPAWNPTPDHQPARLDRGRSPDPRCRHRDVRRRGVRVPVRRGQGEVASGQLRDRHLLRSAGPLIHALLEGGG